MDCSRWHVRILQQAHLNVFQCSLECFEVHGNRLAVAGKGFDLKVYDLTTPEGKNACIFTAQPPAPNQLGIRSPIWISGLTWLAPNNPELVATCWRTEPVVRIYDIRLDGKAVMSLDLRDRSAVHPNPPAFTCISTTGGDVFGSGLASSPGHKKEQLLIGSTVGRLICVDVRLGPHTFQTAGSFKGFGGSVRDVVYIAESQSIGRRSGRVVSCCLDRFVRVHEMRDTGFEKSKALIGKFYLKTRPTCFQPLFNCESFPQDSSLPPENDD